MFRSLGSKAPAAGIAAAFLLTVTVARIFSWIWPRVHWEPVPGMHIHHYVYGIFILVAAGYLALIFKGDRATPWIASLYGLGVGLTFDEFGMWLNPLMIRGVRWNKDGIGIILTALVVAGVIAPFLIRETVRRRTSAPEQPAAPKPFANPSI